MKTFGIILTHLARWAVRIAVILAFVAGVVMLMLWLAGKFTPKVPLTAETAQSMARDVEGRAVKVRFIRLPLYESAVGTIRSVHETTIASKLLARVVEVNLKAGQSVRKGDVLALLDDTDHRARLQQAKAAVSMADAAHAQAVSDERRAAQLRKSNVISPQEYEQNVTAVTSSAAELLRAQESVKEMQAMLDWATVRSPLDGIVTDKKIDVGDMVVPGQVMATLFDPKQMQLVASVRESLAHKLQVGQDIGVRVDVLKKMCSGKINEIVPEAQSASRTFQVKVTGPCPPGIYTGMFGRIMIPLEDEEILVIPSRAVRNVGQLELVDVLDKGQVNRRAVRTGRRIIGDEVEVLAGLSEGEEIVLPAAQDLNQEASRG